MTTVESTTITVETSHGPMDIYTSRPSGSSSLPALIVLQEAFGVTAHIREVTRRFAAAGYACFTPDLYHRSDIRLLGYDELPRAKEIRAKLSEEDIAIDVLMAQNLAQSMPYVDSEKIGVIGFCFGGRAAFVAALYLKQLRAAVSFYGTGIVETENKSAPLSRSRQLACPVLVVLGGKDPAFPQDHIELMESTLTSLDSGHEVITYPEAGHAFFADVRPDRYHEASAAKAWDETIAFLGRYVKES